MTTAPPTDTGQDRAAATATGAATAGAATAGSADTGSADTADVLRRLEAAKVRLLAHPTEGLPYYGAAVSALGAVRLTDAVPTIALDVRWRVHANPDWVAGTEIGLVAAVIGHELTHLLRDHAARSSIVPDRDRERMVWATAACVEVNDDLGSGRPLPPGSPDSQALDLRPHRAAEAHYRDLLERLPVPVTADASEHDVPAHDCGSAVDGTARPWEPTGDTGQGAGRRTDPEGADADGLDPNDARLVRDQVARDVRRAARAQGRVPRGLEVWAEHTLEPRVDWRTVLAAHVRRAVSITSGRVDYSYRRPGRRSAASSVILPTMVAPRPEVAIVLDTSGSMLGGRLEMALAEITGILRGLGLAEATLVETDAEVAASGRVGAGGPAAVHGGGGTDMTAGIDHAIGLRPRPSVVVVLTDGETPWPDAPTALPVIACLVDHDDHTPDPPAHLPAVRIPATNGAT